MFALRISTSNDAFADGSDLEEVARILREVADRIEAGEPAGQVRDINGNTVGNYKLEGDV
jgi:hypothetical protein